MTMRCCASTPPAQPRVAANTAVARPLPKRRMMITLRRLPCWPMNSLSADGKGVERRALARMRRRDRHAEVVEGGLEMTQVGDDIGLADRPHRADANDFADLARMPGACDDSAIALTHVPHDGAAFEAGRHFH